MPKRASYTYGLAGWICRVQRPCTGSGVVSQSSADSAAVGNVTPVAVDRSNPGATLQLLFFGPWVA